MFGNPRSPHRRPAASTRRRTRRQGGGGASGGWTGVLVGGTISGAARAVTAWLLTHFANGG